MEAVYYFGLIVQTIAVIYLLWNSVGGIMKLFRKANIWDPQEEEDMRVDWKGFSSRWLLIILVVVLGQLLKHYSGKP